MQCGRLIFVLAFSAQAYACAWSESDESDGLVPATVLSYRETLTIVESIYYSVSCSHTFTEHRTAVIGNVSYGAAERVYTMLGDNGRTDIAWTFSGLAATVLKPASPVTMSWTVTFTLGPDFTSTTSRSGDYTLSVPTELAVALTMPTSASYPLTIAITTSTSSTSTSTSTSSSSSPETSTISSTGSATPTPTSSEDSKGLSSGTIGGIVAGAVLGTVAVAAIVALAYIYVKRPQHGSVYNQAPLASEIGQRKGG